MPKLCGSIPLSCCSHSTPSIQVACINWLCFTPFPLSVWQEIVFHARQTCKQQTNTLKQNFSETTTPMDKSCMLLFNLWIKSVVCWYYFSMLVLIIVQDITTEKEYIESRFSKVCLWGDRQYSETSQYKSLMGLAEMVLMSRLSQIWITTFRKLTFFMPIQEKLNT